jgi:uncharacterized protein
MRRARAWWLALALGSCASPDPDYYTLLPTAGQAQSGAPATIEVRRIGLAGYLDRSDVVQNAGDYRLRVDTLRRWGEPLGEMIGRVLVQDLAQRLPGSSVYSEAGAISADAAAVLELDVARFDRDPSGEVVLQATLAISSRHGRRNLAARTVSLRAPAGSGDAGQAAAMSTLLGQLADQAAQLLRGLPASA